ncbi:EAL domain-containing protein [Pseudonocardia endophytica]|uniref:EAL domain-containing protein (Putative c-di-GMP-specific phosphodiesterase class I) n=1 Tax=Pseudonocardia endophytica TaxID=401976 RepID=A0A4R1HZD4_PSEEN|nr:EAL domain-containing protein [Pseudonocardia endophytica]TCK26575.1 EAL domain-containing protein (putative c-di-GMP-specific phosphodiesterase class I) [Pseudonocardia endophytica]
MPGDRFVFEPVYDLRSARACGFEVVPRRASETIAHRAREAGWGPRQVADVDAGTVLSALAQARRSDAGVPVQVDLAADTVVLARERLRGMLDGRGVAPMLEIGPAVAAAPPDMLVAGLTELRAWGFRIALDGIARGFGLELVDAVRPDVVKLEPDLSGNPAVVGAVCQVAASVGTRVAATGVTDRGQLASLHAAGVEVAQGPLLGTAREAPFPDPAGAPALLGLAEACAPRVPSRPAMAMMPSGPSGAVPPAPPSPPVGNAAVSGPIRTLGSAAVTVRDDAVADTVRTLFGEHPEAGGVVLVDHRHRPSGYLDRSRFLLAMAGPFGHALWANKPARDMADAPRIADERSSVREAMEIGLSGDPARGYDDLVLVGPDGTCTGVVGMSELWRSALRRDARPVRPVPGRVVPSPVPRARPVQTA